MLHPVPIPLPISVSQKLKLLPLCVQKKRVRNLLTYVCNRMDTLHSIENLPTEQTGSGEIENDPEPLNFRFMARNINIDWRSVSLIDIDRIAQTMDIPALQVRGNSFSVRLFVYISDFVYETISCFVK